jgi:hypothetical protein
MLKKLLNQLFTLCLVSLLFATIFYLLKLNFIAGILTGIVFQFTGFYVYSTFLRIYTGLQIKKIENEMLKELSFQGLEVECPCFKKAVEFVPIRLNTNNYYKCSQCKKKISVLIGAETAVATEAIENPSVILNNLRIPDANT